MVVFHIARGIGRDLPTRARSIERGTSGPGLGPGHTAGPGSCQPGPGSYGSAGRTGPSRTPKDEL